MRFTVTVRIASLLIASAALAGCANDTTGPGGAALTAAPFFIRGSITETGHPWGYRVDAEGTGSRASAAYFTLNAATVIRRADGAAGTAADLTVGKRISVYITGPIMESLPPQVGAQLIILS